MTMFLFFLAYFFFIYFLAFCFFTPYFSFLSFSIFSSLFFISFALIFTLPYSLFFFSFFFVFFSFRLLFSSTSFIYRIFSFSSSSSTYVSFSSFFFFCCQLYTTAFWDQWLQQLDKDGGSHVETCGLALENQNELYQITKTVTFADFHHKQQLKGNMAKNGMIEIFALHTSWNKLRRKTLSILEKQIKATGLQKPILRPANQFKFR